jgi:Cys-tRNA(Pro)/Cys-tRNA(Cys) deacylase
MTPAILVARKAGIACSVHEYAHDPCVESFGAEAAEKLGIAEDRVFKTLVVMLDNKEFVVSVIPVSSMLSMKQMAKAAGAKKAAMAAKHDVERVTGFVLGGVSPLGQKKRLRTFIDASAEKFPTIFISAGRRGLEIELSPADLKKLTNAVYAGICQQA